MAGAVGTDTSASRAESNYNYFRDYDPSIGRYVESDPIGLGGGLNTYAYVGNHPDINVDPLGLDNPGMGSYGPAWSGVEFRQSIPVPLPPPGSFQYTFDYPTCVCPIHGANVTKEGFRNTVPPMLAEQGYVRVSRDPPHFTFVRTKCDCKEPKPTYCTAPRG